jgi:hypothetical protein
MKMKRRIFITLIFIKTGLFAQQKAINLLENGSFEDSDLTGVVLYSNSDCENIEATLSVLEPCMPFHCRARPQELPRIQWRSENILKPNEPQPFDMLLKETNISTLILRMIRALLSGFGMTLWLKKCARIQTLYPLSVLKS